MKHSQPKAKKPKSKFSKSLSYVLMPFVFPLCLIAMGILLLVNPDWFNRAFVTIGILVAALGLIHIIIYASRRKYEVQSRFLATGIVLMAVGTILIIIPFTVTILIPLLIGLTVLVAGISGIFNTLEFRKPEEGSILVPMLFSLTNCVLGIFILIYVLWINPNSFWNIIGILMIISGAFRIIGEIAARICGEPPKNSKEPIDTTARTISEEGERR